MEHALADAVRLLVIDGVTKAQSGHPGMALGMADVATVLFSQFLRYSPEDPWWPNRDRFVLSAGHGCLLLYSLLYLTGYPSMELEDLQSFRQWGSRAPGHPERGPGIEATTGPLGQGLANGVGLALAEQKLRAEFDFIHHYTYVMVSDGCLMEGVSQEAIALAGHWRLKNLIVLFDDNGITIDGSTSLARSEDTLLRFQACGWATFVVDGHCKEEIVSAIAQAKMQDRPSILACRTRIGFGVPGKEGTAAAHGTALTLKEAIASKKGLGWKDHEPFTLPSKLLRAWRQVGRRHLDSCKQWYQTLEHHPQKEIFWNRQQCGGQPDLTPLKEKITQDQPTQATRTSSGQVLQMLSSWASFLPGSADLAESTQVLPMTHPFSATHPHGQYIHYGVREHGMAAIMNGIALHGEFIPCGGTFLVFSDYCRPAIRLAALMQLPVIYVMTHDSIGLGEDGPTHQPVEHLASLRALPNLCVFRPCDAMETVECWQIALHLSHTPSVLCLTRQPVPALRSSFSQKDPPLCAKGAYVLRESNGPSRVDLWATGSEVALACYVFSYLQERSIRSRVISFPSWFLFHQQPASYQEELLQAPTRKVAIEAGSSLGWHRYIGSDGLFFGIEHFGASGPYKDLYHAFGLTAEIIGKKILHQLL